MRKTKNNSVYASLTLHFLGFSLCILPPLICAMSYFPLWKEVGYESCIAGGSAILLIICFLPLVKLLTRVITTYSTYAVWLVCFLLFFTMSKIADQMTVISLTGFIGNLLGTLCFKIARRYKNE